MEKASAPDAFKISNEMVNIMDCNRWHEWSTSKKNFTNLFMTGSKSCTEIEERPKYVLQPKILRAGISWRMLLDGNLDCSKDNKWIY
jgi:hypothetical protein